MKNYIIAFVVGLLISFGGFAVADIMSLPTRQPRSTDKIVVTDSSGNLYGINWSNFLEHSTEAVNWATGSNLLNTSTGRINWDSPNIYLGQ